LAVTAQTALAHISPACARSVAAAEPREAATGCKAAAKPSNAIYLKWPRADRDYCVVDRSLAGSAAATQTPQTL